MSTDGQQVILRRLRFRARLAPTWFLGYQKFGDRCGTVWVEVFIVPGVAFAFGYYWL